MWVPVHSDFNCLEDLLEADLLAAADFLEERFFVKNLRVKDLLEAGLEEP